MTLLDQALAWLNAVPTRYWIAAWAAFGVTGLLAFLPARSGNSRGWPQWQASLFAGGVLLTLAAFRWPSWFYPTELNPDEAQTIAGALTLAKFPIYWKYVDGTTHGPLCEYFLLFAHWLGAPFNYVSARVVATLLLGGSVLGLWGTLHCLIPPRTARVAILPVLGFWSFVSWEDFVHYSSELPGIFLLALGGWLAAVVYAAPRPNPRQLCWSFLAGCALGAVPFAKLQSVPQGLALGLLALVVYWRREGDWTPGDRRKVIGTLVAGALAPAVIACVFLTIYGLWGQFITAYLQTAVAYLDVSQLPLKAMPGAFFHFSATEPAFAWFWWGNLAFALVYVRMASAPKVIRRGVLAGWLLVGVAYYCTLRPGREAVHYLQLLVLPLGLLGGFSLAGACHLSAGVGPTSWLRRAQPWVLFLVLTLSPQVYNRAVSWNRFVGYVSDYRSTPASPAARYILDHMQPGDTLAMWGWEPALYVETGLPQGTREAHTANQLMAWPLQPFFLTRYLRDLDRRRPAWFVDAVGPGAFIYELRHACGYETVPELARMIDTRYELVAEFRNLRIFHLKPGQAD